MTLFELMRRLRRGVVAPPSWLRVAAMLVAVIAYGATGYVYFELEQKPELSLVDGLWWAIVTVTTVGYGDHFPVSPAGRFLVAGPLMLFGIGLLGYVVSFATSAIVEAKSRELRGMRDVRFEDHVIVLNYPSLDKLERVIDELRTDPDFDEGSEVLLVDEDLVELPPELVKRHVHFVRGNPARDETLARANVDRARQALVLAKRPGDVQSDAQSLMITLAIEARAPGVRTTVECVDAASQELLHKAGCDSVVCLSRFDAHFLAGEALHPGLQAVVDVLLGSSSAQRLRLSPRPQGAQRFADAVALCLREQHIALGVQRKGETLINPAPSLELEAGDRVISIGPERLG